MEAGAASKARCSLIRFTVQFESGPRTFLFIETATGKRLLYEGDYMVAFQPEPTVEGEAVDAKPWEFREENLKGLEQLLCSLHDQPSLPVLPPDAGRPARTSEAAIAIYCIHSVQLVDEQALPEENQLAGFLEYGPSFYVTVTTDRGLDAVLLSQDGSAFHADFNEKLRIQRKGKVEVRNASYVRSAIRKWLEAAVGEEWARFA